MSFLAGLFLPGKRTFTFSIIAAILGAIMQADAQGILTLAPMIKIVVNLGFTIVVPLVPIYLRKGLQNALNDSAKKV